jgi:hypothetical protein
LNHEIDATVRKMTRTVFLLGVKVAMTLPAGDQSTAGPMLNVKPYSS